MRINLEFVDLAELQQFADWASARGTHTTVDVKMTEADLADLADAVARDLRGQDDRPVTAEGAVIPETDKDYPNPDFDSQEPASADAGEPPSTDTAPVDTPKRKRRTKAQIAADAAALRAEAERESGVDQSDERDDALEQAEETAALEASATETVTTTGLHPDVLALADSLDGTDSLAHMNEARAFIASQGFPTYSETFKLTGLPSAIAGYTPEQVALHRAVMQWLTAQAEGEK